MPSLLVDAPAVELLGEFRQPSTIVEAILRYSRREQRDPEVVLEDSYPVLRRFIAAGCLGDGADERRGSLAVGDRIAGGTVVRACCVCSTTLSCTSSSARTGRWARSNWSGPAARPALPVASTSARRAC